MDQQVLELFDRFAGIAFDRQQRFTEFLAKKAPGAKKSLDVETGVLSVGPKLQVEALLAGVHSDSNHTWMWTWANRTIKLSLTNRALGDTIRALTHKAMTPIFAKPAFALDLVIGPDLTPLATTVFGSILVGELDSEAYHLAKLDGNPALFIIRDERLRSTEKHPLARIRTLFPKMVAALPISDHRIAFSSYAHSYGFTPIEEADTLRIVAGKSELTATFDDGNRLKKLEGVNIPTPKPASKPKPAAKPKPASKKKPAARKTPSAMPKARKK